MTVGFPSYPKPLNPQRVMDRDERLAWWTSVLEDDTLGMSYRLRASEYLAKAQGDFIERREVVTIDRRAEEYSDDELSQMLHEIEKQEKVNGSRKASKKAG